MIPPSPQDPVHVASTNFFKRTGVSYSDNSDQTNKIRTILQDAHTLQKLAQSHDISQFLNKASATDDCNIAAISALAENISQALDDLVRCVPQGHAVDDKPNRTLSPLTNTGSPKRCYKCGVTDTPRWRRKSSGSPRLCNFCSLVESKRATRRRSAKKGTSVSTRLSWP